MLNRSKDALLGVLSRLKLEKIYAQLTLEQELVLEFVLGSEENILVTGISGCGHSFLEELIHAIFERLDGYGYCTDRNMLFCGPKPSLVVVSGVHYKEKFLEGLNRYFQLPFNNFRVIFFGLATIVVDEYASAFEMLRIRLTQNFYDHTPEKMELLHSLAYNGLTQQTYQQIRQMMVNESQWEENSDADDRIYKENREKSISDALEKVNTSQTRSFLDKVHALYHYITLSHIRTVHCVEVVITESKEAAASHNAKCIQSLNENGIKFQNEVFYQFEQVIFITSYKHTMAGAAAIIIALNKCELLLEMEDRELIAITRVEYLREPCVTVGYAIASMELSGLQLTRAAIKLINCLEEPEILAEIIAHVTQNTTIIGDEHEISEKPRIAHNYLTTNKFINDLATTGAPSLIDEFNFRENVYLPPTSIELNKEDQNFDASERKIKIQAPSSVQLQFDPNAYIGWSYLLLKARADEFAIGEIPIVDID